MSAYFSRAVLAVAAFATLATVALFATGVGASPGSWSVTGSMITPRTIHTATRLADGRVLAAGGVTLGGGRSNKAICAQLFLSPKTVEAHVKHIFMKLGTIAECVRCWPTCAPDLAAPPRRTAPEKVDVRLSVL